MIKEIKRIEEKINSINIKTPEEKENFRLKYLSKKGEINNLFEKFKKLKGEEKRELGKPLNILKKTAERIFKDSDLERAERKTTNLDITKPVKSFSLGGKHPITLVMDRMIKIFMEIGFDLSEGPEKEDDWHNFGALNFPKNHPARDMQDTFFTSDGSLLRTHTSSVQVRKMEKNKPPIRIISPGRVFRNEDVSSRSNYFFHQLEGLYIAENVSFSDLKSTLYQFVNKFFGEGKEVRFRTSYFPFTEPSAEMDVYLGTNTPEDYRLTKGTGWLEILGCGMVDPNVLKSNGIDQEKYTGFAFGLGIDRIAMLKYDIKDIRTMFENDVRFLRSLSGM